MLKSLIIKNYALLEALEMRPSEALSIITGETGAGKSIMLGAIGLLLGNRADKKALYNEEQKCVIEGAFTINKFRLEPLFAEEDLDYDPICILRREVSPTGKSRAFINDTPVRLETMRGVGNLLVDIHSQHDSLLLGDNSYQLEIIDAFAGNEKERKLYRQSFQQYRRAASEYEQLRAEADRLRREDDFNRFLLEELEKAQLIEGEHEQLEEQLQVMENAGNIQEQLGLVQSLLNGEEVAADLLLNQAKQALLKIARYSTKYESFYQRLDSCLIELRDIQSAVEDEAQLVDFDRDKAEATRDRLNNMYRLQQKHQVASTAELLSIQRSLEDKVSEVDNLDGALKRLKTVRDTAQQEMMSEAERLTASREKVASKFSDQIAALLRNLGIPDAALRVERRPTAPNESGADEIEILFSANKGIAPQELKRVASGGEFSRLMFCIKYVLAGKTSLPTIIFDEIDTGVSGEIAIKMVTMMKEMAKNHQVLAISHLPQVAAKGDVHYFVYKDNSSAKSVSRIRQLSENERVEEIAKMIGGNKPSTIAYENAKELLAM